MAAVLSSACNLCGVRAAAVQPVPAPVRAASDTTQASHADCTPSPRVLRASACSRSTVATFQAAVQHIFAESTKTHQRRQITIVANVYALGQLAGRVIACTKHPWLASRLSACSQSCLLLHAQWLVPAGFRRRDLFQHQTKRSAGPLRAAHVAAAASAATSYRYCGSTCSSEASQSR